MFTLRLLLKMMVIYFVSSSSCCGNEEDPRSIRGGNDGKNSEDSIKHLFPDNFSTKKAINRRGRWLKKNSLPSFFTVVNFKNTPCVGHGNPHRRGTCYTHRECLKRKGVPMGSCAWGFGACCVFSKTCGDIMTENCTYFTNPEYDWGSSYLPETPETCELKVIKCRPDICQLRLDFDELDLFGSDGGICGIDSFVVVGGSTMPSVCGQNGGQHIYINVPSNTDHVILQMNLDPSSIPGVSDRYDRRWSIKVTQLECTNPNIAPPGCLQYYEQITGKIMSFNFGTDVTQSTTGYPNNMNYGVCIRKENGYCSIRYTMNSQFQFGINPNDPDLNGFKGSDCGSFGNPGDYIIIPNAEPQNDRYCGGSFPLEGVETNAMPYVLTVVSDDMNFGEGGFMLDYHQLPC